METRFEQIREQQKQSWNSFSSGWKKWDDFNMHFLLPMGETIISSLNLKDNDHVLDIAAGTGEPGITMAGLVTKGEVTGLDLAEDMLVIAAENAAGKGLKNYTTLVGDACELPFDKEIFDAVSCRMGFMFFSDMQQAAGEMHRVLKSGGRIAISVWADPGLNNWVTTMMSIIQKYVDLPAPVPGAPGMFRCAAPGLMMTIFKETGFIRITEKEIKGNVNYQSFDRYWEMMMDVGAPIVAALSGADEATIAIIKKEISVLFSSRNKENEALLQYAATIISAEK
ncbi:class I SAM-dependent methyltransferase [Pedobacter sp. L105]|uniref:class I SAM-dependent methyltransferase n=1 Tax=Pedobacter sp. L105 TaxID=1641871 RepID=UPI00131DB382|nr:methyltransferase domain-containing protein [Pedobacter sp. L105]